MQIDRKIAKTYIDQLNTFRQDPRYVIPILSERMKHVNSDNIYFPKKYPEQAMQTQEGLQPMQELLKLLLDTQPINRLKQNQILSKLASKLSRTFALSSDQVEISQNTIQILRKQLDKNNQFHFKTKVLCMTKLCFDGQPCDPLLSLLIDDGGFMYGRKNREILLNSQLQFVGVGSTKLPESQSIRCTVYLLTKQVIPK